LVGKIEYRHRCSIITPLMEVFPAVFPGN